MEETGLQILLAVVTVLASVVGIVVAAVAVRISGDSNIIANRALQVSLFVHKDNISPKLSIHIPPNLQPGMQPFIKLMNESRGKAIIEDIETNLISFVSIWTGNGKVEYPIILKYNQSDIFVGVIAWPNDEAIKRVGVPFVLQQIDFRIRYKDEIGTHYFVELKYKPNKRAFVGEPVEI